MKRAKYLLAVLAAVTIMTAGIGKSWAYFTTYTEAEGGYTIRMGGSTDITETFTEWTKHVSVTNEGSGPVFVRARAFYDSDCTIEYSGAKWNKGKDDDYYYYEDIVESGESTEILDIKIKNIPEDAAEGDAFNVIVIYESTPVLYDKDGKPYADWGAKLETTQAGSAEGGGEG